MPRNRFQVSWAPSCKAVLVFFWFWMSCGGTRRNISTFKYGLRYIAELRLLDSLGGRQACIRRPQENRCVPKVFAPSERKPIEFSASPTQYLQKKEFNQSLRSRLSRLGWVKQPDSLGWRPEGPRTRSWFRVQRKQTRHRVISGLWVLCRPTVLLNRAAYRNLVWRTSDGVAIHVHGLHGADHTRIQTPPRTSRGHEART